MLKVNRKIILLLVLVLSISFLAGCKKTPPKDVSQDFYDDMIDCLKKLKKYKDDNDKNGIDIVKEYLDNKIWLTQAERDIIVAVDDMYFEVWFYHIAEDPNEHIVKNKIKTVAALMDVSLDIDKLIAKK